MFFLCPAFITLKYVKVFSKVEEEKKREGLKKEKEKKEQQNKTETNLCPSS